MPIAAITECFPITRTAVNKHLHILSDVGLVSGQKIGRETRYKLQPESLVELKQWLFFFEQYWDEKLSVLKKFVAADNDLWLKNRDEQIGYLGFLYWRLCDGLEQESRYQAYINRF